MQWRQSSEAIKGLEPLVIEAQKGSKSARDKIVTAWYPWIKEQARLYGHRTRRLDLIEDMQQAAICGAANREGGLLKAIDKWDASRESQFHSYAIYFIREAFVDTIAEHAHGYNKAEFKHMERIRNIAHGLQMAFGKVPTLLDVRRAASDYLNNYSDSRFEEAMTDVTSLKAAQETSVATDGFRHDMMVQDATQEGAIDAKRMLDKLVDVLEHASERDSNIFVQSVFMGRMQPEIAKAMGVSIRTVAYVVDRILENVARLDAPVHRTVSK